MTTAKRPWRPIVTVQPCLCGFPLIQYEGESAVDVVIRHNLHPKHQAWRARRESAGGV